MNGPPFSAITVTLEESPSRAPGLLRPVALLFMIEVTNFNQNSR